jgi:mannose-6-phosphate isomerase-like protein (cupin superfamily)
MLDEINREKPCTKTIELDISKKGFTRILGGPPETVTMKCGANVLYAGESVGRHSTGDREEVLVVLSGRGVFVTIGEDDHEIAENMVVYCPPRTEHDVINTGSEPLWYVYIVARADY